MNLSGVCRCLERRQKQPEEGRTGSNEEKNNNRPYYHVICICHDKCIRINLECKGNGGQVNRASRIKPDEHAANLIRPFHLIPEDQVACCHNNRH